MTERNILTAFAGVAQVHQVPVEPIFELIFKGDGAHYVVQPRGAIRRYGFLVTASEHALRSACIYAPNGYRFGGAQMQNLKSLSAFQRLRYFRVLGKLCKEYEVQHLVLWRGSSQLEAQGLTILNLHEWGGRSDRYLRSDVEAHWETNNPNIPFKDAFELWL